jgi:hypothetical protein
MNWKRILLGGLLAGVFINASEFLLNGVVLAEAMEADMQRMGMQFTSWAMAAFVIMAFIYGLFLAWLYASIRPRYGVGPRTALIAAAALWVAAYLLPTVGFMAMGVGSSSNYAIALIWGAAELVIAAVLAAYFYQEGSTATA